MCVAGWRVSPGKPRVPCSEERPDAAHSRRDQMSIAGFAPTHPPGAGVSIGRTSVRDASAIPCRGALEVRAVRGIGTLRRHQDFYGLAICLLRNNIFSRLSVEGGGLGSDRWDLLHLAHIKYFVICVRVQEISTLRAATHQCRENHGVDDLHGRSGSLAEMWCQFGVVPWALCPDRLPGAVYKYWAACHSSKSSRGGFCCSVRIG